MASTEQQQDRHAVPRLRSFAFATSLGELNHPLVAGTSPLTANTIDEVIDDWNDEPSISVAADLVSAAIVAGREDSARDAALFLRDSADAPAAAKKMAAICLGEGNPDEIAVGVRSIHSETFDIGHIYEQIHRSREQLVIYPSDPVLWTNLAILYLSLGQNRKAKRAIRVALGLAPHNRFVLRSAARILLHIRDGEEARALLSRSANLKTDPWLLAAEISTAAAMDRNSELILFAQRAVEADKFSPFDSSELNAELATIRALDGNVWLAKKFLKRSMKSPSENAMAQAAWLGRVPGMPAMQQEQSPSHEANAWIMRSAGKLTDSMLQTRHWLDDQPFSAAPAEAGSFIATRIDRLQASVRFAEQGLRCNPSNSTLLNNLAFSAAKLGDVECARKAFKRINLSAVSSEDLPVFHATEGLVAFRSGEIELGRRLYTQAIQVFRERGDPKEAVASIYYAMEELRIGSPCAAELRSSAINLGTRLLQKPEDIVLVKRLEALAPEPRDLVIDVPQVQNVVPPPEKKKRSIWSSIFIRQG